MRRMGGRTEKTPKCAAGYATALAVSSPPASAVAPKAILEGDPNHQHGSAEQGKTLATTRRPDGASAPPRTDNVVLGSRRSRSFTPATACPAPGRRERAGRRSRRRRRFCRSRTSPFRFLAALGSISAGRKKRRSREPARIKCLTTR